MTENNTRNSSISKRSQVFYTVPELVSIGKAESSPTEPQRMEAKVYLKSIEEQLKTTIEIALLRYKKSFAALISSNQPFKEKEIRSFHNDILKEILIHFDETYQLLCDYGTEVEQIVHQRRDQLIQAISSRLSVSQHSYENGIGTVLSKLKECATDAENKYSEDLDAMGAEKFEDVQRGHENLLERATKHFTDSVARKGITIEPWMLKELTWKLEEKLEETRMDFEERDKRAGTPVQPLLRFDDASLNEHMELVVKKCVDLKMEGFDEKIAKVFSEIVSLTKKMDNIVQHEMEKTISSKLPTIIEEKLEKIVEQKLEKIMDEKLEKLTEKLWEKKQEFLEHKIHRIIDSKMATLKQQLLPSLTKEVEQNVMKNIELHEETLKSLVSETSQSSKQLISNSVLDFQNRCKSMKNDQLRIESRVKNLEDLIHNNKSLDKILDSTETWSQEIFKSDNVRSSSLERMREAKMEFHSGDKTKLTNVQSLNPKSQDKIRISPIPPNYVDPIRSGMVKATVESMQNNSKNAEDKVVNRSKSPESEDTLKSHNNNNHVEKESKLEAVEPHKPRIMVAQSPNPKPMNTNKFPNLTPSRGISHKEYKSLSAAHVPSPTNQETEDSKNFKTELLISNGKPSAYKSSVRPSKPLSATFKDKNEVQFNSGISGSPHDALSRRSDRTFPLKNVRQEVRNFEKLASQPFDGGNFQAGISNGNVLAKAKSLNGINL